MYFNIQCCRLTSRGQLKPESPLKQSPEDQMIDLSDQESHSQASVDQLLVREKLTAPTTKLYRREYDTATELKFNDLVRVAIIGQGGFGRVELVSNDGDNYKTHTMRMFVFSLLNQL